MSSRHYVTSPTTPSSVCSPNVITGEIVPEHGEELRRLAEAARPVNSIPAPARLSTPETSISSSRASTKSQKPRQPLPIGKAPASLSARLMTSLKILLRALFFPAPSRPPVRHPPWHAMLGATMARINVSKPSTNSLTTPQNTAGATHSGLNLQNELRKGVRTFIKEKGGESVASKAGFIPAETEAMTLFSRGTLPTNALRYTSAALGGGGGIGAPIAAAAYGTGGGVAGQYFKDDPATAGAVGLMAPVLGTALRMVGNRRANNEIAAMRDMIARRSPLYDYRTSMSGMQPGAGSPQTAKAARDALALALLKQQTQPEQKYESW